MIFKLLLVVAVKPDLSNRRPTGVFFAVLDKTDKSTCGPPYIDKSTCGPPYIDDFSCNTVPLMD